MTTDGELTDLVHVVAGLRDAVDKEREAREYNTRLVQTAIDEEVRSRQAAQELERASRQRSNRLFALVLAVIMVVSLFFTVQNNQRVDDITANRLQSRIQTCLADNETASRVNAGNEAKAAIRRAEVEIQNEIDALVIPVANQPTPSDPQKAKALADYIAAYQASQATVRQALATAEQKIEAANVPVRDCSPAAVNAFYNASSSG